jgi:hypothetical protein
MRPIRRSILIPAALALLLVAANGTCSRAEVESDRVYGLTADSTFAQGCFPPLACPVALAAYLGGTFRLHRLLAGDGFELYEVREVYWVVRNQGQDLPITGSGTFEDGVDEDRLILDLRLGEAAPETFDSGLVPSGPAGSSKIDITISLHGQTYLDTVIGVHAIAFERQGEDTPCGPSGLVCRSDTEICVARTPVGPATVYTCEPVPQGCEQDRTCSCAGAVLCRDGFDVCSETGPNQLQCECPLCQ